MKKPHRRAGTGPSRIAAVLGLLAAWSFFLIPSASADVELPAVLDSNMVLQQKVPVTIWGWADRGEDVSVSLAGFEVSTTAGPDGFWKVIVPPLKAGGPYEMTVRGKNEIRLTNILSGEVWVCSGQSNMEWSVDRVLNAAQEIALADHPSIRLFHVPRTTSGVPLKDVNAKWRVCSPGSIPKFSAAAYFFGRTLQRELDVPVGLINTSWGGTRIEPWTPLEGFESVPELSEIKDKVVAKNREYREDLASRLDGYASWLEATRAAVQGDGPIPAVPGFPGHGLNSNREPTGLYNAMVHPLVNFAIRGAIWYQGEANREDGMAYHHKMKALINGWRAVFDQGAFPFYFVQIAPYRYGNDDPEMLPRLWEAQVETLTLPQTGIVVTTDIANLSDIHPRNKQVVGERLALWALAGPYRQSGRVCSGPIYRSMSREGNRIRIHFAHGESGLISRDGKPLSCFQIAGEDKNFVWAEAVIEESSVVVFSDKVENPAAVRFGWHKEGCPNLANKAGLPALPFRTDRW